MTERYFNDLTARVGTATVAVEDKGLVLGSVPVGINKSTTRYQLESTVDVLDFEVNDSTTWHHLYCLELVTGLTRLLFNCLTATRQQFEWPVVESKAVKFKGCGLGSVTATVVDLYVCWKPGFRIELEALLSCGTRQQQSTTLGVGEALVERECCLDSYRLSDASVARNWN